MQYWGMNDLQNQSQPLAHDWLKELALLLVQSEVKYQNQSWPLAHGWLKEVAPLLVQSEVKYQNQSCDHSHTIGLKNSRHF